MRPYYDDNRLFAIGAALAFFLLVLSVCGHLLIPQQGKEDSTMARWWKGIVLVVCDNEKVGSGFFLSGDGIICTALHITKGYLELAKDKFHVRIEGQFYPAEVIYAKNGGVDILFLRVKNYKPEAWFDKFKTPEPGEKCVVLGYPVGWRAAIETTIIKHEDSGVFGINERVAPGSSGSVVLSEEGEILGMIRGQHEDFRGTMIHSRFIAEGFLRVRGVKKGVIDTSSQPNFPGSFEANYRKTLPGADPGFVMIFKSPKMTDKEFTTYINEYYKGHRIRFIERMLLANRREIHYAVVYDKEDDGNP